VLRPRPEFRLRKNLFFQFPAWENFVCIVSGFKTSSYLKLVFHWFPALRHLDLGRRALLGTYLNRAGIYTVKRETRQRPLLLDPNEFLNLRIANIFITIQALLGGFLQFSCSPVICRRPMRPMLCVPFHLSVAQPTHQEHPYLTKLSILQFPYTPINFKFIKVP
jgi:hypothetical protein